MGRLCAVSVFIFLSVPSVAQHPVLQVEDSLFHEKFLTMVNFNKDQSYISFGNGIGNQRPILFEAQLSPSYLISNRPNKWAIMVNPQVQIRMLDAQSLPIQVPSYHFNLTYYRNIEFWQKSFLKKLFYDDAIWFTSITHHSNGQSGNFYLNDTTKTINLTQGSFSVNYFQFGVSSYTLKRVSKKYFSLQEIKVHTEIYPSGLADSHLKGIYGFYRLFGTFGFGGPWKEERDDWVNSWLEHSSVELKAGWIFGEYRGYAPLEVSTRLIIDLNYKYYPPWFDELAFFIRFYSGQDYYNIYFEKQLRVLSAGITSNTIKLTNAVKVLGRKAKE
jgi:hypothetical protein